MSLILNNKYNIDNNFLCFDQINLFTNNDGILNLVKKTKSMLKCFMINMLVYTKLHSIFKNSDIFTKIK